MAPPALTLRQLRYFLAVAREKHFGRAAEACAVSQPALSMQVQELEAVLGSTLLERRRGDVTLTETGMDVARRAVALLNGVQDLADAARHGEAVLTGPLALGAIPSIAPYLLPGVLPMLAEQHPGLALSLLETQTARLLTELRDGSLDAVLIALPLDEAGLESIALFDDPFLMAMGASPAPEPGPLPPEALARSDLLLLEEGHCLRDQALAVCGRLAPEARRFGATSLTTILQMVANGYGVTLLPGISVQAEIRPGVAIRPFAAPVPSRRIGLAWRRSSPRQRDFLALGAVLRAAGEKVLAQSLDEVAARALVEGSPTVRSGEGKAGE